MQKIGYILIICHLLSIPVGAQHFWSLDECMDYAIAHNTELKHLQNEQRRREVKAQSSKDARLPQFYGDMGGYFGALRRSGDHTKFNATGSLINMGVSGMLPLYTGNRLSSQIKADNYSLKAATEDVHSAEKNLRIEVAAAYLQVLYNKGEEKIAQQRLEVSQLLLKQARSLYDKGKRPESDVAEATAMVSRDEALLTAAEGDISLSELDLKQLLNLPDSVDFNVSEPTDSLFFALSQLPSTNYASHPSVQSAYYSILQAEQGVKTARSGYYPTLSLVGEFGTFWSSLNAKTSYSNQVTHVSPWGGLGNLNYYLSGEADWKRKNFLQGIVGLKLSIPLFNGFQTKAHIRTAKINLEDAKLAYDDAQQRIQKDIRQTWQSAFNAFKRYEAEVKSEESSALAYRYASRRYEAGMATLYNLSQSRQQWFDASENALRMKYEYLIRKRIYDILCE